MPRLSRADVYSGRTRTRAARARTRPAAAPRVVPRRQSSASAIRSLAHRKTQEAKGGLTGYWNNFKRRWGEGGGPNKPYYQAAGALLGGSVGSLAGGLANRAMYALTGYGDYTVKSNALLETNGPPSVVNRSNKEFIVRHREYITDIYSLAGSANTPSAFGLLSFSINPGDATTFPWLSTIADKFEQYRIEGMVFEYKSLYSDAVVTQNGSIGSIVLATEYNAGAAAFTSKQAMENYQFAQSCKPSCSVLHPIECARSQNVLSELYIRPATVPAGEDVKTYDFGDFQIASQGIPLGAAGAAVNLGELWVSYQIAFIKPKIPTGSSTYKDSGFAYFSGTTDNAPIVGWGTVACPANFVTKRPSTNIDVDIIANDTFRVKCLSTTAAYQVDWYWYGTATSATAVWRAPSISVVNGSFVNAGTTSYYQNVREPTVANINNGCAQHFLIIVPASTPSQQSCTISINGGSFSCDQVNGVRFEGFFNAIPYPLAS